MADILFLVHGMGKYGQMADGAYKPDPKGWFADAEDELRKNYDLFIKDTIAGGDPFDARFTIQRVEFDSIFETFRDGWQQQSANWNKLVVDWGSLGLGGAFVQDIEAFFAGNKPDAFLWTHLADAALYMAPTVRAQVQAHVAHTVVDALAAAANAGTLGRWSVIAHSLGSAVMHDSLADLQALAAQDPVLDAAWTPPRVICMAANVARLLSEDVGGLYADTLAPTGPDHPFSYISCRHELDPFTAILPFDPPAVWTNAPRYADLSGLDEYFLVKEVIEWIEAVDDFDKFASVVPHGLAHYLRQSGVAAEVWPRLVGALPSDCSPALAQAVRQHYAPDLRPVIRQEVAQKLQAALAGVAGGQPVIKQLLSILGGLI